jgi:hypothetical protein
MSDDPQEPRTPEATRSPNAFPKLPLEEALRVPRALANTNAAKPLPPIDTANALEVSPGSSGFRTLLSGSLRYGLTTGTYQSARVELDALGRSVVTPRTPDDEPEALVQAALRPSAFTALYEHYKGNKLPASRYMVNTAVREVGVMPDQAERCVEIFLANVQYVGLTRETKGGLWLAEEPQPQGINIRKAETPVEPDALVDEAADDQGSIEKSPSRGEPVSRAIFVGARKGKPRDQLMKTLDQLGIPYKVAEDEPNRGRPISRKVQETMAECGAGILVFTADDEYFDKDGVAHWRPCENVVHELGAASFLYDNRIIVFKEEAVELATNYSDLGYIEFEKDKLDAKVNELLRELLAFKILAVSVTG